MKFKKFTTTVKEILGLDASSKITNGNAGLMKAGISAQINKYQASVLKAVRKYDEAVEAASNWFHAIKIDEEGKATQFRIDDEDRHLAQYLALSDAVDAAHDALEGEKEMVAFYEGLLQKGFGGVSLPTE